MSGLANALVIVGLGPCGLRIARDLEGTADAIATPTSPPHAAVATLDGGALGRLFAAKAAGLLEAGAGRAHGQARDELRSVEDTYKRLAGFDIETLNHRPSWSVQPAAAST